MNLYGLILVALGVITFSVFVEMGEPFTTLGNEFSELIAHIRKNDIIYNTTILICLVVGLSGIARWLIRRGDAAQEKRRDRLGNRPEHEAGSRGAVEAPREEGAGQRRA